MSKRTLVVLIVLFGAFVLLVIQRRSNGRGGAGVAGALAHQGYKEDDAGRVVFENPNGVGLSLAYDPNLHDPTTGFRSCLARINSCLEATKEVDRCVREAPRCVSATPWKNDPAGDDCCPESCVQEYFDLRKTQPDTVAYPRLVRGTCYPGMKALLNGKIPRKEPP
jgi:hypothetical protein